MHSFAVMVAYLSFPLEVQNGMSQVTRYLPLPSNYLAAFREFGRVPGSLVISKGPRP